MSLEGKEQRRAATRLAAVTRSVLFPLTMWLPGKQLLCLFSETENQLKSCLGGSVLPFPHVTLL